MVLQSLSVVLLWMLINMTAGIYFNLAFFETGITIWNIIFYLFFAGTFYWLTRYLRKKWKGFKEVGEK